MAVPKFDVNTSKNIHDETKPRAAEGIKVLEDRCRLPVHLCALLLASMLSATIPVVLAIFNAPFEFKQQEVGLDRELTKLVMQATMAKELL